MLFVPPVPYILIVFLEDNAINVQIYYKYPV